MPKTQQDATQKQCWSFLMTSWRLLDNFLALLQYSWSIGKDQEIFWNFSKIFLTLLLLCDTSWHFLTCLGASWRRLSSFLMSSCLLLDDSWVDLPILGKKKSVRNKQEVVAKSQEESRTCQDSAKKPWRIPHTTYIFLFFSFIRGKTTLCQCWQ